MRGASACAQPHPSCSHPVPSTSHGKWDRCEPKPKPRMLPALHPAAAGRGRRDAGGRLRAALPKGPKVCGDTLCSPPPTSTISSLFHQEAFSANSGASKLQHQTGAGSESPRHWMGGGTMGCDPPKPAPGAAHRGQRGGRRGVPPSFLHPSIPPFRLFAHPPSPPLLPPPGDPRGEAAPSPQRGSAEPAGTC